jgi:hypothetical protein
MPIQEAYPQIYFSKDSARFKRIYEQMRRIGGCFQRLEARPVIEDGELLCEMQVDFSLAWFESEGSAMPLNWYTIYPLEVFYDKRATFASCILRIEENLGKIFEETRSLNIEFALNARVSRLIRKGRESLDKSKKLLDVAKIQSERRLREYSTLEKKLKEKMADFKGREDNEAIVAASSLEKQARTLQQLSLKEMANLQETTSALKTMQLKSDEIYYQLACAINSLVLSDC